MIPLSFCVHVRRPLFKLATLKSEIKKGTGYRKSGNNISDRKFTRAGSKLQKASSVFRHLLQQ